LPPLIIPPKFKRVMSKKPASLQAAILECVYRLGDDPRHPSLRTHRVQGAAGVFEAYVDRANRVTFEWAGDTIVLRNNCSHDILKRNP
jgi:mRNA interferase RelE/StbE